jgi:hypothetical protein
VLHDESVRATADTNAHADSMLGHLLHDADAAADTGADADAASHSAADARTDAAAADRGTDGIARGNAAHAAAADTDADAQSDTHAGAHAQRAPRARGRWTRRVGRTDRFVGVDLAPLLELTPARSQGSKGNSLLTGGCPRLQ